MTALSNMIVGILPYTLALTVCFQFKEQSVRRATANDAEECAAMDVKYDVARDCSHKLLRLACWSVICARV